MQRLVRPLVLVSSLLIACGGGGGEDGGGAAADGGDSCAAGESRCLGSSFEVCGDSGRFVESESCSASCDAELGCVECRPGLATCVDRAVHQCEADGTVGDFVEVCEGGCTSGSCDSSTCGASGTELIYVVDVDDRLLSFDPSQLGSGDPFTVVGTMACPSGAALPEQGGGPSSPFSMSVDRNGTAWVLYNSGEIFHVSTGDASCESTSFSRGQEGFELFGMGFVSDAAGSDSETLFLAGGDAALASPGELGTLERTSLTISSVGPLPNTEYNPELTGTGDAGLYAYFPGQFESFVAKLDKATVGQDERWDLDPLGDDIRAWAFAHWGGKFYIFITTGFFTPQPRVLELDPATGDVQTVVPSSPYVVVGAGVSTCAPVVVD